MLLGALGLLRCLRGLLLPRCCVGLLRLLGGLYREVFSDVFQQGLVGLSRSEPVDELLQFLAPHQGVILIFPHPLHRLLTLLERAARSSNDRLAS